MARRRLPAGAGPVRSHGLWLGALLLAGALCVLSFYAEPAVEAAHQCLKFAVEAIQIAGKPAEFGGVNICLCHRVSFDAEVYWKILSAG